MKYRIRDGIVMDRLCGIDLLIATLEARKTCPYVMQLNEASAFIWRMLFDGIGIEEMAQRAASKYQIPLQVASDTIMQFLNNLVEQKYIELE